MLDRLYPLKKNAIDFSCINSKKGILTYLVHHLENSIQSIDGVIDMQYEIYLTNLSNVLTSFRSADEVMLNTRQIFI